MENKRALYEEDDILNLEFDDGAAFEVGIMGTFDLDGITYIALESLDDNDNDVYLYRYVAGEDDFDLEDIPEADFDRVAREFDRLVEENG